jgi:septum site-determining protein MinC
MENSGAAARAPAIELRFGHVNLAQVRLRTLEPHAIRAALGARVASAPRFFDRTAVSLDLSALASLPEPAELRAAVDAVRSAGVLPIGLAHGATGIEALADALSLPVIRQFRDPSERRQPAYGAPPAAGTAGAPQAAPAAEGAVAAQIHDAIIRSGQRVYARGRDLVVTATVGAGSEVIADGSVHVYGALRGRAIAGARGDAAARVFCQEFHAELVSIAGVFRVFETIPPELEGRAVQARLEGEDLHFARIGAHER